MPRTRKLVKVEANQQYLAKQKAGERIPVPTDLTNLDAAFGNIKYLPKREAIGEDFWRDRHPANSTASMLFFKGGKITDYGWKARDGINPLIAQGALRCILVSFEPQHEHKIAGVAMLIDQWFVRAADGN